MTTRPTRPYGRGLGVNMVIRVTSDLHARIKKIADKMDQSVSDWVRNLVDKEIRREEDESR